MHDVIIVGSGPASIASALQLKEKNPLILDVGITPPPSKLPQENIYNLRNNGSNLFDALIGENFSGIQNLQGEYLSPKLKGPQMRYVWEKPAFVPENIYQNFDATLSYAEGGLANAWGAGLMRYNDEDLTQFPIKKNDLEPFYDILTEHIGISGIDDGLMSYFGSAKGLLPPPQLSPIAQNFHKKYHKKSKLHLSKNIHVGRLRSAVLTQKHNKRAAYQPYLQDFFQTRDPGVYTPAYTLRELLKEGKVVYKSGYYVNSYKEEGDYVVVLAVNCLTGVTEEFKTKKLLIGAGAINSSKIVLRANNDYTSQLPILDNPVTFIPFIDPSLVGTPQPMEVYPGAELVAIYDDPKMDERIQASIYGLYGPLRTDLIAELPFSTKINLNLLKYISPALGMLQIFFPDHVSSENYITLNENGSAKIKYSRDSQIKHKEYQKIFLRMLYRMKYISFPFLCKSPVAGSSIHYAGCLPMRDNPSKPYETGLDGLLWNSSRVHIIDAATFPDLPSKNHSFTIMANSMRIAKIVENSL